jgi:hypothetical protein
LCNEKLVCEECTVGDKFIHFKAISLRPIIFQMMKELEYNVDQYEQILEEVGTLRSVKLRKDILDEISFFFSHVRKVIDEIESERVQEVHDIFKTLKFDELDDIKYLKEVKKTGNKAL